MAGRRGDRGGGEGRRMIALWFLAFVLGGVLAARAITQPAEPAFDVSQYAEPSQ